MSNVISLFSTRPVKAEPSHEELHQQLLKVVAAVAKVEFAIKDCASGKLSVKETMLVISNEIPELTGISSAASFFVSEIYGEGNSHE